jgi:transposase
LAQDETDLLLFPPLRSGWAPQGKAAPVLISGSNARRTIFGSIHVRKGKMLFLDQRRKKAEDFMEFLDLVHWHYRNGPVALILDENSIHTAQQSQSLAEDLDIQLLFLPLRSPHLNPMDQLWRHGKQNVCANAQQSSIDQQVDYFLGYYNNLSPKELRTKAGLCSPSFWLYQTSH